MRVDGWSQSKFFAPPTRESFFILLCSKTFVLLVYICGCIQFDGFKIRTGQGRKTLGVIA